MVRKCRKAKPMMVEVEAGCVSSSTYMQLRSRRIVYIRSEKSSSVVDNEVSSSSCEFRNVIVDDGFIDLKEETDGDTETTTYQRSTKRKLFKKLRDRESNKSMENSLEITADFDSEMVKKPSDCCSSGRKASSTALEEKAKSTTEQPTELEIEDFFIEAEKELNDKFKKKYNFDFEKEKPLEGRYEWVKLSE